MPFKPKMVSPFSIPAALAAEFLVKSLAINGIRTEINGVFWLMSLLKLPAGNWMLTVSLLRITLAEWASFKIISAGIF